MNGIKRENRNSINLLSKNVNRTRPTAIHSTKNKQLTRLLPKQNSHKLAALFGLIKILIDQLSTPMQKEKEVILNQAQKQGRHDSKQKARFSHHLHHPLNNNKHNDIANIKLSNTPKIALNTDNTNSKYIKKESENTNTQQLFEVNKRKWQQSGIKNYFYTFQRSCFCTRETTYEVLTHVRNDHVINSQFKDSGLPLPNGLSLNILSINDLFTTIETALDKHVAVVKVKYNNETGQPISIYIDGKTGRIDDEFSLIAKNMTVI